MHDQSNQRIFLFGIGFGHQQRQRGKTGIVNYRIAARIEQTFIAMQKIDK